MNDSSLKLKILKDINEIFIDIFDDESIVIDMSSSGNTIKEWDSMAHINIIIAIEKEFDIQFSLEETMNFENMGEIINTIIDHSN